MMSTTECTCAPCPIHGQRQHRLQKDSTPPTAAETETLKRLKSKRSPSLTDYMISLYEGTADGRSPDEKASIRQIADALDITYAAVYQRLSEHIKSTK